MLTEKEAKMIFLNKQKIESKFDQLIHLPSDFTSEPIYEK